MSWWTLAAITVLSVLAVLYLHAVPHVEHRHGGTIALTFLIALGIVIAINILWSAWKNRRGS